MSTTILKFSKLGKEDLEIGTGTFEVELSDGRKATLNRINLSSFLATDAVDTAIYFTNGSQIGQDSLFTWDTDASQFTIGAGGSAVIGEDTTVGTGVTLHVSVDGESVVRIENSQGTSADTKLEFAMHGAVDWNFTCDDNDNDNLKISAGPNVSATPRITLFRDSSQVGINTTTLDTYCTQGLVISQGSADDNIIAFRSSDIAHGITDFVTTDTYGCVRKIHISNGGCLLIGLTEDVAGVGVSGVATNENTASASTASGVVYIAGSLKSGATYGALSATANLMSVRNYTDTVFLIKGDGDVYNAGGSTAMSTFDDYDDAKLLAAVRGAMDVNYKQTLGEWVHDHTAVLEQHGVITRDGDRYWISQRGFRGLLIDYCRQVDGRLRRLESLGADQTPRPATGV
jgi:hypothetical protein